MTENFSDWRKSGHSEGLDECVEVGRSPHGTVGIRDTKHKDGPILEFTRPEWHEFTHHLRHREQ